MNDQDVRSFFVFLQGESHAHGMHPAEHCLSHVPLRIIIIFRAFILNIYAVATIRRLQAPLRAVLLQQFALEFSVFFVLDLSFSCPASLFLFSISLAPSTGNFCLLLFYSVIRFCLSSCS